MTVAIQLLLPGDASLGVDYLPNGGTANQHGFASTAGNLMTGLHHSLLVGDLDLEAFLPVPDLSLKPLLDRRVELHFRDKVLRGNSLGNTQNHSDLGVLTQWTRLVQGPD
jgi:hypothetical protein